MLLRRQNALADKIYPFVLNGISRHRIDPRGGAANTCIRGNIIDLDLPIAVRVIEWNPKLLFASPPPEAQQVDASLLSVDSAAHDPLEMEEDGSVAHFVAIDDVDRCNRSDQPDPPSTPSTTSIQSACHDPHGRSPCFRSPEPLGHISVTTNRASAESIPIQVGIAIAVTTNTSKTKIIKVE